MHRETTKTAALSMTLDEYILFEEQSEQRHEFIDNQLFPMPGTTDDHNYICQNIAFLLRSLLKQQNIRIFTESVKVQITHQKDYTYPDVMVAPDPRDVENKYIKQYPSVIFEVISKTSRMDDAVDKFIRYKQIESLQNYILVDAEKIFVEVRTKMENGAWEANTYFHSDGQFPLPTLNIMLNIDQVYEGVVFV
jgi:Uma2 family endonuclease